MPPHNPAEFDADTDDVFARIAYKYDKLHDIFSFRIHRLWKSGMAKTMAKLPGELIFDAGAGTGDIPERFLRLISERRIDRTPKITLGDSCPQMLEVAQDRLGRKVSYLNCDVHDLTSVDDGSYDIYTNAFLMKLCSIDGMATEAYRILKPGGYFVTLEASRIPFAPLHWLYLQYMGLCLPLIARLSGETDQSIWKYFLKGINNMPNPYDVSDTFRNAGFEDVSFTRFSLGIVALHVARKPFDTR